MSGVWNGFLLGKARKEDVPCRFCGKKGMEMGHLFWERTFPPLPSPLLLHVRELPEFATLMALDRSKWPRCLSWHGWLPGLSGADERDPGAASFGQLACCKLECRLGAYPGDTSAFWTPPEYWDADDIALEMSDTPHIKKDGSRGDFSSTGGFEAAGAGVYVPAPEHAFEGSVWVLRRSMEMLAWSVAVLSCPSLGLCRLFSVLNSVVPSLLCSPTAPVIWVLTTSMLLDQWIVAVWSNLCLQSKMEIWLLLYSS